jgi:hypothetical protein
MRIVSDLKSWFVDEVALNATVSKETNAYIVSVLSSKIIEPEDSIVLQYIKCKNINNFSEYQKLGDWLLWTKLVHNQSPNKNLQSTIAQLCYYSCYRITENRWQVFKELADKYEIIKINALF